ncbi:hypothetical protein O6H91_05G066800 [Diphasiastrum complanatum]|uniref:Uncharacterized protein n=1 Tax=Diphasiastrum complanatum TaxID=34168 RepID=A0ACC2DPL3_DIPCM|nr:hypothetical protein O6H91_05G066800 [Diphasiastrum complanatum]
MDNLGSSSEGHRSLSRYGTNLSIHLLPSPISALLELSGLVRSRSHYSELDAVETSSMVVVESNDRGRSADAGAEVAIRIIGDHDQLRTGSTNAPARGTVDGVENFVAAASSLQPMGMAGNEESGSSPLASPRANTEDGVDGQEAGGVGNSRDATTQRYDFQPLARWVEQVLPFSILLFMVFVRQHLQGLVVTLWITAIMIKANDILRKQTALKDERKTLVLVVMGVILTFHIIGIYWWCKHEAFWRPLILLPPREIPKFWHAIFTIVLNDTMARLAAMVFKCYLLFFHKNNRSRKYRQQAQVLTLVEYILLLYRALIPGPVWYRFFLNKEYGNLFSSLTTGLYLTFKLTSVFDKVQTFITALRALSRREVPYGAYATSEEVLAAGDLCAICQEKMHVPISLCCKHLFCEDCVSEWFERERTCPLCRAVVKSADLRSFGDGSTGLFVQIF